MSVQPLLVATVVADGERYRVAWFDPPFAPPLAETTRRLASASPRLPDRPGHLERHRLDAARRHGRARRETLEQTLAREVWEGACARVRACAYIGCQRVEHLDDDRPAYYQTRFWARVELEPFAPTHEMTARVLVRPSE